MNMWSAAVPAALTTFVLVVITSLFERKLILFPLVCGLVSFVAGYAIFNSVLAGVASYAVVYVLVTSLHPMRRRQLDHDEEAWRAHRHLDEPK